MASSHAPATAIDRSLDRIRAAIRIVADGDASRVTVRLPEAARVLPAARRLGMRAGVVVELVEVDAMDLDLVISPHAAAR